MSIIKKNPREKIENNKWITALACLSGKLGGLGKVVGAIPTWDLYPTL